MWIRPLTKPKQKPHTLNKLYQTTTQHEMQEQIANIKK
jgi:hypothetical protein